MLQMSLPNDPQHYSHYPNTREGSGSRSRPREENEGAFMRMSFREDTTPTQHAIAVPTARERHCVPTTNFVTIEIQQNST